MVHSGHVRDNKCDSNDAYLRGQSKPMRSTFTRMDNKILRARRHGVVETWWSRNPADGLREGQNELAERAITTTHQSEHCF